MRKLLLVAALALGTAAWAQTAGNPGASQPTDQKFDQQQSMPSGQSGLAGDDWYNGVLSRHVDQFIRVNNGVSPTVAGIVDQQDQFNGAAPGAMAANLNSGEDWYNRKIQADAELNRRTEAAIRSNPNLDSADVE